MSEFHWHVPVPLPIARWSADCLQSEDHEFSATEPQYGFTCLMPRGKMLDPAQGFLHPDGSVVVHAVLRQLVPSAC